MMEMTSAVQIWGLRTRGRRRPQTSPTAARETRLMKCTWFRASTLGSEDRLRIAQFLTVRT